MYQRLPGLEQARSYQSGWLRWDALVGVTVAAYLVPQVMAYGVLAGLEPVAGLWASGRVFALARVKQDLLVPLRAYGLVDRIGSDRLFPTLPTAETAYQDWERTHPLDQAATRAKPPAAQPADDSGNAHDGN